MPQEPKKRHSRQRQGKRRANIKILLPKFIICENCKKPKLPHIVCQNCGHYGLEKFLKTGEEREANKKAPLNEEKKRPQT